MIDSINLCVHIYVRLKHLSEIGIIYKRIKNGVEFTYKNIKFVYMIPFLNLRIETHAYDVLRKIDITLSDRIIFSDIVNKAINEIVETEGINYIKFAYLTRFDYCINLKSSKEILKIYSMILKKHPAKYKCIKRNKEYDTSNYLSTPKSGRRINMYKKEDCEKEKLRKIKRRLIHRPNNDELIMKKDELEIKINLYKGIYRIEVQLKKDKLKRNAKTSTKSKPNKKVKERILDKYWIKESAEEEFFEYLEGYLYLGDYYHLETACNIIFNSSESISWREKLVVFLLDVAVYNIDNLTELKIYSPNRITDYIDKLNALNINPITLDERFNCYKMENLLKMARRTAEEKYFK